MTSTIDFDPSSYTRAPIITLQTGITLCEELADACPPGADTRTKKAATHLRDVARAATDALAQRQRLLNTVTERQSAIVDHEADDVWGALRQRLQAYAALPVAKFPRAPAAAALEQRLFGAAGLTILKLKYAEQRTEMQTRLKRIDDEHLAADLETFAGREFLEAVRDVQPRYDAMVKDMLSRDDTLPSLQGPLRAMQLAIVTYATRVCAGVDEGDARSAETASAALAPLRNHREMQAASASNQLAATPEAPATPSKPV